MADSKIPSALAITNVKSLIPITLDLEDPQYQSWVSLFKNAARAHDVLDHIITPVDPTEKAASAKAKADNLPLWKRLDAVVLQWIYASVSKDVLNYVLKEDDTAADAWARVRTMFLDNQNSRAMFLNKEFHSTTLADFSSTSTYCNRLKTLSDQLKNVGSPVPERALVLRLLDGLTDPYDHFVTVIQHAEPFPDFASARSKLALEETTQIEKAKAESGSSQQAMIHQLADDSRSSVNTGTHGSGSRQHRSGKTKHAGHNSGNGQHQQGQSGRRNDTGGNYGGNNGRRNDTGGNYGGNNGRRNGGKNAQQGQQQGPPQQSNWVPSWWLAAMHQQQQLLPQPPMVPPPPYPAQAWVRPTTAQSRPPATPQAYNTQMAPTDIDAAMYTQSLYPPPPNWIMDTGATSHMTSSADGEMSNEM